MNTVAAETGTLSATSKHAPADINACGPSASSPPRHERRAASVGVAKRLLIAAVAAASVTVAGLGAAAPAYAAVKVGPIDQFQHLKPWCERQMRVGTILGSATPDNPWNAYSWKCRVAAFYRTAGIDMNAVCRNYYGGNTYARTNNPGWAWSWECWRN